MWHRKPTKSENHIRTRGKSRTKLEYKIMLLLPSYTHLIIYVCVQLMSHIIKCKTLNTRWGYSHVCTYIYIYLLGNSQRCTHIYSFHLMRKHKNVELLLKTQNPCLYLLSRFPKGFSFMYVVVIYMYILSIHVRTNTTKCHKYDYTLSVEKSLCKIYDITLRIHILYMQ